MEFDDLCAKFKVNDGNINVPDVQTERKFISKVTILKRLWRSASKQRVRRALTCIIRGDFKFLWHQINRFSLIDKNLVERGIDLEIVLKAFSNKHDIYDPLYRCVDLVVPVYNGYEYLEALISSITKNTASPYRLIVVDDASPDPRVWPLLQSLVLVNENAILLRNEKNLGFVKTVNKATQYVEGDFVLLNTDVEVPEFWLERLMEPIRRDRSVATTTPFSNAATICSFPKMNIDNELPSGVDFQELDSCFRALRTDLPEVVAPTGVGFCMGVNGDIWQEVGGFDELFSLGYGEENDWCQRALSRGYRNIIVQNLFVYHKHGGSFETETRAALREENYKKLIKRWPKYPNEVRSFIEADPLEPARNMAIMLAYCNKGHMLPTLIIDHEIGGGANTYRQKQVEERLARNEPVFVLTAPQLYGATEEQLTLDFYYGEYRQRYEIKEYNFLHDLFKVVRLGEIFFNNIISYKNPLSMVRLMMKLKSDTKARLILALHDFYMLNPSYTLLNTSGVYLGLDNIDKSWIDINNNTYAYNPQKNTIAEWHSVWGSLVASADEILCFSDNSRKHLLQVYPDCKEYTFVRPHKLPIKFTQKPNLTNNKYVNIAIVGSISYAKGCGVVAELVRLMEKQDKYARITVVGIMEAAPNRPNLHITGPYQAENLPRILEENDINVCLLPSICPETFSYVAEELMALGVPLVCFDIGAPAERVAQYEKGHVVNGVTAVNALEGIRVLLERLNICSSKAN